MFCLKCILVEELCPESRWIDYPAPRSPADSFVMAGPIRHCLLRACQAFTVSDTCSPSNGCLLSLTSTDFSNSSKRHRQFRVDLIQCDRILEQEIGVVQPEPVLSRTMQRPRVEPELLQT